jgi:hypothetical protein
MTEKYTPVDRETLEGKSILMIAPDTQPVVIGIDTRISKHSLQTIITLPLVDVIKPCPQMPNLGVKAENLNLCKNLSQIMSEQPLPRQQLLSRLVAYNVINRLNNQRKGIEDEHSQSPQAYLLTTPTFTHLAKAKRWETIRNTIKNKDEGHLLANLDNFIKNKIILEHDPRGYITGENGSILLWQRHDN